jgi:hypothetical protein
VPELQPDAWAVAWVNPRDGSSKSEDVPNKGGKTAPSPLDELIAQVATLESGAAVDVFDPAIDNYVTSGWTTATFVVANPVSSTIVLAEGPLRKFSYANADAAKGWKIRPARTHVCDYFLTLFYILVELLSLSLPLCLYTAMYGSYNNVGVCAGYYGDPYHVCKILRSLDTRAFWSV